MDQKILVRLFFPFENVNILPAPLDGMVDSVALNVFEYLKGLWKKEVEEKGEAKFGGNTQMAQSFLPAGE